MHCLYWLRHGALFVDCPVCIMHVQVSVFNESCMYLLLQALYVCVTDYMHKPIGIFIRLPSTFYFMPAICRPVGQNLGAATTHGRQQAPMIAIPLLYWGTHMNC